MAQITINNWLGGLSPSDRLGKENSYYQGDYADPITDIGYLTPGKNQTNIGASDDATPIVTNWMNSATYDSANSKIYAVEYSTKLHKLTVNAALTNDSDFPHTIGDDLTGHFGHTTFEGEDVVIYPIGSTNYLFYSWNDNTDGDVGRVALTGSLTFEDDNLSNTIASGAVLTNDVPHPMLKWEESGKLLVANGNDIVSIDGATGTDGTADMDALNLPQGWTITALFPAGDLIGICAYFSLGFPNAASETAVFFWDGSSTKWTRKVTVPGDNRILAAKSSEDGYYIFGNEKNSSIGTIRKWNGNNFTLVARGDTINGSGYPINYGSVAHFRHGFAIMSTGGDIFYYGSPSPGIPPLYCMIGRGEGTNPNGRGIISLPSQSMLVYSSRYSPSGAYYWTKTGSGYDTNFLYKSLYYEFPQKARINFVRVYFKTLTSGADDDIKIESDYGDITTTLGSISYSNDGAIEHKRFNKMIPCHNFRVVIDTDEANATTGIQYAKIVVDYDLIDSAD